MVTSVSFPKFDPSRRWPLGGRSLPPAAARGRRGRRGGRSGGGRLRGATFGTRLLIYIPCYRCVYRYVCMCVYVKMFVHISMYIHMYVYVIPTYANKYVGIYAYMHRYIHMSWPPWHASQNAEAKPQTKQSLLSSRPPGPRAARQPWLSGAEGLHTG